MTTKEQLENVLQILYDANNKQEIKSGINNDYNFGYRVAIMHIAKLMDVDYLTLEYKERLREFQNEQETN